MSEQTKNITAETEILGHPVGLFVQFFTEMWERFSYYGMRAILILFLITKVTDGGWGWERKEAYALYGWYVMLVYFLPMVGGWIADHKWGHVKTVIVGSLVITSGHATMAIADLQIGVDLTFLFYVGLLLIVLGTGLFKPNMSSIVGKMYTKRPEKKDSAYSIFYMGVNAGAFIGTLLVGWIAETFSWSWGFGLAGVFMLFGLLQFYFARDVFGKEASTPSLKNVDVNEEKTTKEVPFTQKDKILGIIAVVLAGVWVVEGVTSVVTRGYHFLPETFMGYNISSGLVLFLISLVVLITLGLSRLKRFEPIERDRLKAFFLIAFFVVFFWASFEQAGSTMTVFAKDYTSRTLSDTSAIIFKVIDFIISIGPMLVLTWVIVKLAKAIYKKYKLTVLFTSISFLIIWALVIFRVYDKLMSTNLEVDVTWFQILNPLFIVSLAPLYSKFWERTNFSGPQKFFGGLTLLALGFLMLVIGASSIPAGAKTASVSMIWLLLAYLFHTMGELSISPVGLSYVSKLAPARMMGFMFGIWYIFTGLANKTAGILAEYSDSIAEESGLSGFFLIFTVIPFVAGLVILALNKKIKKLMHGIH
ncbi:peptide MFS transporter [Winogradskyella sp.]|jgi:POT family proton-dependent oligopeptide transporter|uniref:peptide MFS transporter n=1 Tax=Winogradskyella sp. TaxID=1883156 RepID=UPI0025D653C1|nr:peptide MFS transporter [Winogradskyella sp.]MCT4629932.1 peptide MFS transporter [Winogradskyella sp.]